MNTADIATTYCKEFWRLYDERLRVQELMYDVTPANREKLLAAYHAASDAIDEHRRTCGCHKRIA